MPDPQTTQQLFNELDTKHPDYLAELEYWELYRDILGDAKPDLKRYLPRGAIESDSVYDLRVKLAEFVPESNLSVTKIVSAVYKMSAKRDLGSRSEEFSSILKDADLKGTSWSDFAQDVCRTLLGYTTTRVLVNVRGPRGRSMLPAVGGTNGTSMPRALTVAEEKAFGVRPYFINYNPLSVIDWATDDDGNLSMVRIKEERVVASPSGDRKKHARKTTFIEYDRTNVRWWEFIDDGGPITGGSEESRTHNLGKVPMIVVYHSKQVRPMVGSGILRFAAQADKRLIRASSDLHFASYLHAHPTLWASVKRDLGEIGVGSGSFLKLDGNAPKDEIGYLQLPSTPFDAQFRIIDMNRQVIVHHTGVDPLGVLQAGTSAFQTSGAARAWSFETSEGRILSAVADKMESFERQAFEIATRLMMSANEQPSWEEPAFDGEVIYPDEFDMGASDSLLDVSEKVTMQINSPTLVRTLHKRIASVTAGEIDPETANEIRTEIDDNDLINTSVGRTAEPTEMPAFGFDEEMSEEEAAKVDELLAEEGGESEQEVEEPSARGKKGQSSVLPFGRKNQPNQVSQNKQGQARSNKTQPVGKKRK